MEKNTFWHLDSPDCTAKRAEWDEDVDLETVICPIDDGHQHPGKRLTDLSIVLPGGAVQDFVWTWYSECLVQDHVVKLFKEHDFTGYDVKPAKAIFKRASDRKPPKLWELTLLGWAGMAPAETGIRLLENCPGCGHLYYSGGTNPSNLIDISQWDGSDFFMVWPLPNFIFMTDRVTQVIRENHLTGTRLIPLDSLNLSGGFSPGRLSYSMPIDRAHKLGAALGIE
jgi:hypothetical protein